MTIIETPVGRIYLLASGKGLRKLSFIKLIERDGNRVIEQQAATEVVL